MRKDIESFLRSRRGTAPDGFVRFSENIPSVYECLPTVLDHGGRRLCAWLQCRSGLDVVVAREMGAGGSPMQLSGCDSTAGPPQLCTDGEDCVCLWESCTRGKWRLNGRRWVHSSWSDEPIFAALPRPHADRIELAGATDQSGRAWIAWVELGPRGRSLSLCPLADTSAALSARGPDTRAPYRPRLTLAGDRLWLTWEEYTPNGYRVKGCPADRTDRAQTISTGPGSDVLHTTGAGRDGRLWVAWTQSLDAANDAGVVDQWQSIRAARRTADGWEQLPAVADLCHGLLPLTAVWGYCGRRRHPMLVADDDSVWVLWERKDEHDSNTWKATGILCGRRFRNEHWGDEHCLVSGLLDYRVSPEARGHRASVLARDVTLGSSWDSGAPNVFEAAWGNLVAGAVPLDTATPRFSTATWTGWRPVDLSRERPERPRYQTAGNTLFWGDPHVHTAQSGDAEGEIDELLHYAQDKARLDFCAVADNDVYCLPLTDHEWARQKRLVRELSEPGQFAVIPLYEWSWADPVTLKPNHRLVAFPDLDAPLRRHIDPGGEDINALASSVREHRGLLIAHHVDWVFAESEVEAAIEIVSAWSPHMLVRPDVIHSTLNTGRRLAFTGGSDSHRRNPGYCGALTGVYAASLDAAGLIEGIRKRRTIATTGTMVAIEFHVGDAFIGDDVRSAGVQPVVVRATAPRSIEAIRVVRDGETVCKHMVGGRKEAEVVFSDTPPPGSHWYYAHVHLCGDTPQFPSNVAAAQGSDAWTSPIWVEIE